MTHVIIADVEAEELFGRWEGGVWALAAVSTDKARAMVMA